jgi:hypothetical protein
MKYDKASVLRHAIPKKPLPKLYGTFHHGYINRHTSEATDRTLSFDSGDYWEGAAKDISWLRRSSICYQGKYLSLALSSLHSSCYVNAKPGSQRCVQISSARPSTDGCANPPPFDQLFSTNFKQDEKDGILACRVGDPNDDWS